ncbi:hypothetical protein [Pseudoalteromonas maricaloris]|uniref:hypothetical protein n=1 Tax=Pseudoalteromonas maricaloris TaxID=184924 RepID=UPI00057FB311|nr:hypothetical protein [Pseudoalteromonas flavipulchra]KID37179.1 hypothetical protein QT15_07680 [Pseudoalteromonas flavipulchra NCIMB 2033 = ATCC BAA-314]MBD0782992.1 hypothetical protein [Pseudoalteromonas flavipulchra]MBE0374753.1 hypothetical protein [Pseudoalteromonas flavipulchra NCIMB 2033 = ATCC BAA-314]
MDKDEIKTRVECIIGKELNFYPSDNTPTSKAFCFELAEKYDAFPISIKGGWSVWADTSRVNNTPQEAILYAIIEKQFHPRNTLRDVAGELYNTLIQMKSWADNDDLISTIGTKIKFAEFYRGVSDQHVNKPFLARFLAYDEAYFNMLIDVMKKVLDKPRKILDVSCGEASANEQEVAYFRWLSES